MKENNQNIELQKNEVDALIKNFIFYPDTQKFKFKDFEQFNGIQRLDTVSNQAIISPELQNSIKQSQYNIEKQQKLLKNILEKQIQQEQQQQQNDLIGIQENGQNVVNQFQDGKLDQ
ncbi:hypothetical protein PPERSA_08685 [Pseudocohnilembus persalinus]|uniref:Uncharacterized protein n=1 Tax=Pseudocohnilembus persalinus TaxID=266149 RepID=A0A0V0R893_PSEPJ|nr:hypothetical protein PPERSA_08685 [Pseudocohnilembus persalinus]|eukprot:KRX10690.1 hypothetical protein PPERSA_08685 [Pseudocohnilembus persalinus]